MKVLNLQCGNRHSFEGWFRSDDDYSTQLERGHIECPMCADHAISKLPSAPRLNLHSSRGSGEAPAQAEASAAPSTEASAAHSQTVNAPTAADLQAAWLRTVRHLMANTEDVGPRFAEEARRIHYGEEPNRGIRGQATPQERQALQEEGIETMSVPVPEALKGSVQ